MYEEFTNYYEIDQAACVRCGACQKVCPVEAVSLTDGKMIVDPEKCLSCGTCGTVCPKNAVNRHQQKINRLDFDKIDPEKLYFNPGCAISVAKPYMPEIVYAFLKEHFPTIQRHDLCCLHEPKLPEGSTIIVVCPGCDTRFNTMYEGVQAISFWEIVAAMDNLTWPDQSELKATIQDSCDYRNMPYIHDAVRSLLKKMNVEIEESQYTRENSMCCGVAFMSVLPEEDVEKKKQMRSRQLPNENVVTYCMGCETTIHDAGKNTIHLLDLLFDTVEMETNISMREQTELIAEYKKTH